MTTSSQRLLDLYQLSATNEEASKPAWSNGVNGANGQKRVGSEHRKRNTANSPISSMNPPTAPEVPRGPPISYRNSSAKDNSIPQRSFSQRAKGRPFATEAFADEADVRGYEGNEPRDSQGEAPSIYEDALAPTYRQNRNRPLHVDTGMRGAKPEKPSLQTFVTASEVPQTPSRSRQSRARDARRTSDTVPRISEPLPLPQRSNTLHDATDMTEEQQREWAPDRSPLQKLEVTLNDISKEEKRARVEEAEMLLRESKAGRGGRRASGEISHPAAENTKDVSVAQKTDAATLEDAGLVRSLSSKQRDRLHHSATVDSRKPDVRRLSGEGRGGFEYQEQQYSQDRMGSESQDSPLYEKQIQSRRRTDNTNRQSVSAPRSGPVSQGQLPENAGSNIPQPADQHGSRRRSDNLAWTQQNDRMNNQDPQARTTESNSNRYTQEQGDTGRAASARQTASDQSVSRTVPTNITRAVSLQTQKPLPAYPEDDDGPRRGIMREANSSHKAALAGAAAAGAAAVGATADLPSTGRSNSRRLQKTNPSARVEPPEDWKHLAELAQQRKATAPRPLSFGQQPAQRSVMTGHSTDSPKVETFQRGIPRQVDVPRSASHRIPEPVGLGLKAQSGSRNQGSAREGSEMRQVPPSADPAQSHHTSEVFRHKPRQHSVSFKEPLDRARPVDEWKQGGIARLSYADQVLDGSTDAESNKAWWENEGGSSNQKVNRRSSGAKSVPANHAATIDDRHTEFRPPLYLKCGPLLRYTGMKQPKSGPSRDVQPGTGQSSAKDDRETWRGSVLIVTQDSRSSYDTIPTLRLFSQPKDLLPPPPEKVEELAPEYVDPIAGLTKVSRTGKALFVRPVDHLEEGKDLSTLEDDDGLYESSPSPLDTNGSYEANTATSNKRTRGVDGESVGKFKEIKGSRLYADPVRDVTFWRFNIEIELGTHQAHIAYRINRGPAVGFWVPARGQSMNIMFHSCNGFSMSVNPDLFSGPDPLWRDVLNTHQTRPFHVMIGGGDQIYNDRVMVQTKHFGAWTQLRNPHDKHHAPFSPEMKDELESFYLDRYDMWFSQGLFAMANSQIPMVNMWDDHDIIDGFGSYPDHFMRSPVFSGLGNIAFKYYMLFQHHSVPEETMADEPSWLLGAQPGPYVNQLSHSVFMHMGKHVAFLGLDCRTERRRDEIMTPRTYDNVLERCRNEIIEGETKHLIVLLGVPIAYPRLVWLENVLTSRAMDPIKALGRVSIFKGGFLNKFDGGVEILDDLDDHWTAKNHKQERNEFILDLQDLSAEKSVRITILGGDVHLAAVGQFYSNPKLRVPKDKDHRYMPNIISSAIVNTPPPDMMADILNKREKVHQLNHYTSEDMIPMFTHDVDGKRRNNKRLLPRRNWCSIREYHPGTTPPPTPPETPSASESDNEDYSPEPEKPQRRFSFTREDVNPRSLFRRISSRGVPPSSYRDDMDFNQTQRPASMNGDRPARLYDGQMRSGSGSLQQTPFSAAAPNRNQPHGESIDRRASFDQPSSSVKNSNGHPVRPGNFTRRPTNLSEKAARKGIVPGVDKEGNEVDVNEHINLEGGLDIILNCEISQKDPAGITMPYRLLVPALWYDGSSDREKLDGPLAAVGEMVRKPTLLKRMGLGGSKRGSKQLANGQGSGNWGGDMSETESYSGSEDEPNEQREQEQGQEQQQQQPPKRRFSLFGRSLSRRRDQKPYEQHDDSNSGSPVMNKDQQMQQEDYASARQQAARQAAMPAAARGSTEERLYAGGLTIPGASQAFWDKNQQNAPRTVRQARVLRGEASSPDNRHGAQGGLRDSGGDYFVDNPPQSPGQAQNRQQLPQYREQESAPSQRGPHHTLKSARIRGGDNQGQQQQYQDQQAGSAPNSTKLARVLGEQPQYAGPTEWGRSKPPDYYSDSQSKSFRTQSQRASSGGGNSSYYPPSATSQGQRVSSGGYDGVEAYKEPKERKRRWSLTGGRKWIGDGTVEP